jgi:hypothetical protein
MKKKIIFIVLAVWINITAIGQNPFHTDYKVDNLKGKVKSITETNYVAVDKFGNIEKGEEINWVSKKYNTKGYTIEINQIPSEEDADNLDWLYEDEDTEYKNTGANRTVDTYIYKYNNKGKITEFDHIIDGTMTYKYIYKYDDMERLTTCLSYNAKDSSLIAKFIYQYNNGKCTEMKYLAILNLLYEKKIYDNKYKLLEKYEYNEYGNIVAQSFYEYDNKGTLVKTLVYDSYEILKTKALYNSYEDISEIEFYGEDHENQKGHCIYKKYDAKGNWLERITYEGMADIATAVTERKIEYYE